MKRYAPLFLAAIMSASLLFGCTAQDVRGAEGNSGNAAAISRGTPWEQMVKNARVHDADGDLTDYENAYTPGSLRW